MKKKCLIIILFFLNIIAFTAQVSVDNEKAHRRYWYYRTRMINDFMKIGKDQGDCIVFPQRNNGFNGVKPEYESKIGPDQIDITNMYIMSLALEYKLLSRNNQDASETIKELYNLLYTINRLDLEAEQFWDATEPSNDHIQSNGLLNGFMLREDMPKDYIPNNITHYNYALLENNYPNTPNAESSYGGFTGIQHTNELTDDNQFSDFFNGGEPKHKMPLPQDKYHTMLVAMMFIDKYIPSDVNYNGELFQDGKINIREEAREIAKRVYSYCKGTNNAWKLQYIDSQGNSQGNLANSVGGDAWIYSFALSRMTCHVNSDFPWSSYFVTGCSNYSDPNAKTIGYAEYNLQSGSAGLSNDNAVFKAWDQAGTNAVNAAGASPYMFMSINTSAWSIEWAELLRKVLHQKGALLRQMSVYGDPIDAAPCLGPYNYGACYHGGWEWSSQDRLEHADSRGNNCNNSNGVFRGNYPGVDYMLLHNLYYEYQNQILDGNNGNVGPNGGITGAGNIFGNFVSTIYNSGNTIGNNVSSAACSIQNWLGGVFQGNSNICDPTVGGSGNGYWGSNNVNLAGYYAYNYMDNKDENIWPRKLFSSNPFNNNPFSPNNPANNPANIQGVNISGKEGKVAVFQNLTSKAHIYATSSPAAPSNTYPSNVTYRAGKEIVFEPGFTIDAGSTFHAHIQRYLCNGNSDAMQMRKVKDSSLVDDLIELDYETDIINPIPIHYVISSKSNADNHPVVNEYNETTDFTEINELAQPSDFYKATDFIILPNPSKGVVKVQTTKISEDEKLSIRVYDMKGLQIIVLDDVPLEQEINLQSYSKGIYLVQIISNLGKSASKKIDIID